MVEWFSNKELPRFHSLHQVETSKAKVKNLELRNSC